VASGLMVAAKIGRIKEVGATAALLSGAMTKG
jgi:hypothetical protein